MTMPANQITSHSNFYLQVDMCYNDHCRPVEVPWVNDLTSLPKLTDIAILDNRSGRWKPGLYVRTDLQTWRIAMTYEDVCNLLLNANAVKVINFAGYTEELSAGYVLFRNAQRQDVATITPSENDIYVSVFLEAEFSDMSKMVTKTEVAGSADILQVSGGADRSIKDWVPVEGGLVKVDEDGKAAIAVRGTDYERPATATEDGVVRLATADQAVSDSDEIATTPSYVTAVVDEAITDKTVTADQFPDMENDEGLTTPAYVETAITAAFDAIRTEAAEFPAKEDDAGFATPAYVEAAIEDKVVNAADFPAAVADDEGLTTPAYVAAAVEAAVAANLTLFADAITDAPVDAPAVDSTDPSLDLEVAGVRTNALSLRTLRSVGGVALGYAVMGSKA